MASTLVVGLGNLLLGDDGIGWHIANQVRQQMDDAGVEVDCLAAGGLNLMERLIGYDYAILVDAVSTGQQPPGTLYCSRLEDLPDPVAGHTSSAHDTTLRTAMVLGRRLGAVLPGSVMVVGVETRRVYEFTQALSPEVAAAVPRAAQIVETLIQLHAKQGFACNPPSRRFEPGI